LKSSNRPFRNHELTCGYNDKTHLHLTTITNISSLSHLFIYPSITSDDLINQAKNKEEVIKYIDAAIPFIELPDIIYSNDIKINGPALAAINVAARYGIIGDPILIGPSQEWMERLRKFKLQIVDENDIVLSEGTGSNLLDDPLNVVLWIKDSLIAEGKRLKKATCSPWERSPN